MFVSGDEKPYYFLSTVAKAMAVLEQLSNGGQLSVSEIARRTSMPKSVVHRILATLTDLGYVAPGSSEGIYRIGVKSLKLGLHYLSHSAVEDVAPIHMQDLVQSFPGGAAFVATLEGTEVLYRRIVVGTLADYYVGAALGRNRPAYCTSLGKVLLAYLSPLQLENYLANADLRPFTSTTITSPTALREALESIRRQEYAIDDQEYRMDRRSVSVPIRDFTGRVVAALGLAGLPEMFEENDIPGITARVKFSASAISQDLGYTAN